MRKNSGRAGLTKLHRKDTWRKHDLTLRLYKTSVCIKIVDYMVRAMETKVAVPIPCPSKINDKDTILNLPSSPSSAPLGASVLLMLPRPNISDVVDARSGKIPDLSENAL